MDEDTLSLYQDLIQIYLREPACREDLLEIAGDPATYPARMAEVEHWLDRSQNDQPAEGAAQALPEGCCRNLFNRVVTSEPLLEVFRREPRLSGRDPSLVVAMGSLADIHPDPQSTFQSGDRMFMRILPKAVLNLPLSADEILKADFSKLVRLKEISPAAFDELVKLAQPMQWRHMAALESFLGEVTSAQRSVSPGIQPNGAPPPNAPPVPAGGGQPGLQGMAAAFALIPTPMPSNLQRELLVSGLPEPVRPLGVLFLTPPDGSDGLANQKLIDLFLESPLFSETLPEEVQLFNQQQEAFTPDPISFSVYVPKETSTLQMSGSVAGIGMENLTGELLADARRNISLRIDIAEQYLRLREYTKLDVLNYKWPSLADELRKDPEVIKRLEALFIEKATVPEDLRPLYQEANQDKTLVAFLRLRPLFRDMKELKAKAVATTIMPEKVEASEAVQGKPAAPLEEVTTVKAPVEAGAEPGKVAEQYYSLTLTIHAQTPDTPLYAFELKDTDQKVLASNHIELDPAEIEKRFQLLPGLSQMMVTEVTRNLRLEQPPATRAMKLSVNYDQLLRDFGTTLYNWFIKGNNPEMESLFLSNLGVHDRLRLLVEINPDAARLHELPWESLYVPPRDIYLGRDSRYSLVRKVLPANVRSDLLVPMRPPLRVLAALSSPRDMPPINIQGEAQLLSETLQEQVKEGNVELTVLTPVTREGLQMALLRNRPDIVHFVGHGVYDPAKQTGILLAETEDGKARPLYSEDLKELLADQKVRAVVLNGCHTGSAEGSLDVTTSIAGMLVEAGIPLVVATLREVLDNAALLFSRTFYTSLATGTVLESALAEARKALKLEGFDWTAYALYTNTDSLDQLVFLPRRPTR